MSTYIWKFITCLIRGVLSLRYTIEVKGLEKLTPERLNRKEGILFLPNHPAHMDPPLIFLYLWPKFRFRPLVIEEIYNLPLLKPLVRLVKSLPIPNFEIGVNEWKVKRGEQSIRLIAEGLKKGENFILYPAGRLKNSGKELLGGTSGANELLKECPDANIVLIRTTGLWGSSFSKALLGRSPEVGPTILNGIKILFKNFLFFAPRRKILIEIEPNPEAIPRGETSRIDLNRALENWYNQYPDDQGNIHEIEPIKLVSYSRWKQELPKVAKTKKETLDGSGEHVSEETKNKIYNEIRKILDKPDLEIKPEMNLAFDLGMDSLNIAEFIIFLMKNYDLGEIQPEELETVGGVLHAAEEGTGGKTFRRVLSTFTWPKESNRPMPMLPIGKTVSEAFLNSCQRMKGYPACGDDLMGPLSYRKLKKGALVLAQYFKQWEEERIAIMLPSSVIAYAVILALQLAGKVPVMLNWTLGPRYLEEMIEISGAQRIITSSRFLSRVANVQFGKCLDKFVLLEDVRKKLTLSMKLRGLFLCCSSVKHVMRAMDIDRIDENHPAVILFTSGTEAKPKGVPLSHKNLISDQRAAMTCFDFRADEVVYGILPPFHSFGLSVAGLFPILGGIKIAFYHDPTDGFALAEGTGRWKVTMFCGAPSFLKGLFSAAKKGQLKAVRLFVSGAEKAPAELYQRIEHLGTGAKLVEGYGVTECSPVVSINRPNLPPKGVGRLLPDMEAITIHPETFERLPKGANGEICVHGPNVFNGYLGNPRSPFIEFEGKQWYRTGDLGHIEPDGTVILSGRLKRFTKLGGEMISLGAVEEVIVKSLIDGGRISPDVPSVAVVAKEREEGKAQLILFVIIQLSVDEANGILQKAGFSNLVKISDVKKIDEIPLMGAGKTNYRSLQDLC